MPTLPQLDATARGDAKEPLHGMRGAAVDVLLLATLAALVGGVVVPILLTLVGGATPIGAAAVLALAGLWLHGHAVVLAGQGPPIS